MKKNRKVIAIIIAVLLCLPLLASCGSSDTSSGTTTSSPAPSGESPSPGSPAPVTTPGGTGADMQAAAPAGDDVRYASHIDMINDNNPIAVLNPFSSATSNSVSNWAFRLMFDSLTWNNHDGTYVANLATHWDTSDFQTYTFYLRDDVYFHNGDKMTADDVVWTAIASREGVGSQASDMWRPVETITAIDDYTVEIVLSTVNVDFLHNMSMPMSAILNQRAIEADAEKGPWIGTGAFYVTDFATGDFASFARNDNYWGEPPITETLTMRFVPEMSTRTIMMQNGESQVCFGISSEDLVLFEEDTDNFSVFPTVFNNPNTLNFNMDDPIAGDYNFRMAVASAIDRAEISIVAAGNWAAPETEGTMWGFESEFRNRNIPIVPYDLDAARAYLDESPYNGEEIVLSTAIITNVKASEAIQDQLSRIGINIVIDQMDSPSLAAISSWADNRTQVQMFVSAMQVPASTSRNIYYPGAANNRTMYNNPEVTALYDEVTSVTDRAERERIFMRIQEIIAEDPPIFNVFWRLNGIVGAKGIGGMFMPADVYYDLRYIYWNLDA